tara:strand:- start:144 stop:1298 length:1155 start_codon:yes stop_codon:yes gene_type:complete
MNLLEKYSTNCGVKISNPRPATSYFPLRDRRYIIVDDRNLYPTNSYDLFEDVLAHLGPSLDKHNIEIYAFHSDPKKTLVGTQPFINLTKKQEAYLIKNAELVVACDNLSSYYASAFKVPSVGLYSAYPAACKRPLWSDNHVSIESERQGNLPGYGVEESPKAINFIEPEKIASVILDGLGLNEAVTLETIYLGDLYPTKVVEVIPDFTTSPDFLKGKAINLRADYNFNEELVVHWVKDRVVNLMIDEPISLNLLKYFKKNIVQVTINLNDSFSEEYLQGIIAAGVPLEIFCEDKDKLANWRFKFFDFDIEESIFKSKSDLDESLNKFNKTTKFLSGKVLLSEGEKYSCLEAKKQKNALTGGPEIVYDTKDFWKELDHYRLFNNI